MAVGVHGDVPGVVEVDDLLEALEEAVVHVRLDETRVRPHVDVAVVGVWKRPRILRDVARSRAVELGPIEPPDGIATEAPVDVFPSRGGYTRSDC